MRRRPKCGLFERLRGRASAPSPGAPHRIVIVGGDAGGLDRAAREIVVGEVRGKGIHIQSVVAGFVDGSLYRSHRIALHGFWKTALDTLTGWLRRQTDPG